MNGMMHHVSGGNILHEPNTFIGGVGANSVTSAADLAALTSLSVGYIKNFVVDANNNVSCYIGVSYSINGSAFQDNLALTYYIDVDGYCTSFLGSNTFRSTKNLEIFYMPSLISIRIQAFIIDGVGTGVKMDIWSATALTPIGETAGNNGNFGNRHFDYLYSNSANATNNGGLPDGDFSSLNCVIDNLKYSSNTNAPTVTTGLNTISKGATYIELGWTAVSHTNAIDWYLIFVDGNYIGKSNTTSFLYTKFTESTSYYFKIIAIDEMGNASPFSATYTETTNATDITDLALVTAYGSALKVDWSFILDSEVDYYEVYVDNVFNKNVTTQEALIIGLALNTSYDIKVRGHYASGGFTSYSNVLTQSTNAVYTIPVGDIVSYWKFDGNSNDSVGSNNGTDTAISYVAGLIDDCADFTTGITSKISVPDANSLSFGNGTIDTDFSFVTLVKFNTIGNSWFFNKREVINNKEYQLSLYNGNLRWQQFDQSAGGQKHTTTSWSPNTTDWYVISVSAKAGEQPKLYINRIDSGIANNAGSFIAMENLTEPLTIGKASWSDSFSFDGYMNVLTIFDKDISAGEISDIVSKLLTDNEHLI